MVDEAFGWTAPDRERRRAWQALTYLQRLQWLSQAKVFALRAKRAADERAAKATGREGRPRVKRSGW